MPTLSKRRILIIDDQAAIHEDYRKIICPTQPRSESLDAVEAELFGCASDDADEWDLYEIDSAYQGQEAVKLIEQSLQEGNPYAVAFVDIRMPPGWDGIKTVRRIWEIDPEILVVICSAHSDYSWQDIVQQLGRTDRFLILKKPFDNVEVRQCAAALAERWLIARTDALTGILNRRAFKEHLHRDWAFSLRHERPLSCIMLDIDYFKTVNDVHGHAAGDRALTLVSQLLRQHAEPSHSLCRFGGDELCVLMPGCDEAEAQDWADRLCKLVGSEPLCVGDEQIRLTMSCGVASLNAATARQGDLIEHADAALRAAKLSGRNRVCCWTAHGESQDQLQRIERYASEFKGLTAGSLMTKSVETVGASITVGEAAVLFLQTGLAAAPVVNTTGELVGLLSEKDIVEAWGVANGWSQRIEQVMSPPVIQYQPESPAEDIFKFLCRVQLRQIFITEHRRPVGVITCSSFLQRFCASHERHELACCSSG